MERIVVRPRIQIPVLVVLFTGWSLLGVTYFTNGNVVAERDWFGVALGCLLVASGVAGIWRALRLGVVIDAEGVRARGFDSRDRFTPWNEVESVECLQIDDRAGLPIYAPVVVCITDGEAVAMPLPALGSYSKQDAERKTEQLRRFNAGATRP